MTTRTDQYQEIRDAVRALCAQFPDEYFRKVDEERAYTRSVRRRADQGRLAGRADPGGVRRLGPRARPRRRSSWRRSTARGGNAGACHGQMYNMGTLLRHGSRGAEAASTCRRSPSGELRLQSMARDRADHRHRHDEDQDHRRAARATATSSTARRCGSRASSTPT